MPLDGADLISRYLPTAFSLLISKDGEEFIANRACFEVRARRAQVLLLGDIAAALRAKLTISLSLYSVLSLLTRYRLRSEQPSQR